MLATLAPPISRQMNLAHNLAHSISLQWFAENALTFESVSERAEESNQWEYFAYRGDFQKTLAFQISLLPPCPVVVVEIPTIRFSEEYSPNPYHEFTAIFKEAILHGTHPAIVCLGSNIPAHQVIEWMQMGIFTYAENCSHPTEIIKAIDDAKAHASRTLEKYLRFQRLDKMWNAIESDERVVLNMVFEGLPNKVIASRLNVSQRTIEARRHRIFEKFESKSLPVVVRRICEWHQLKDEFCGETRRQSIG